VAIDIPKIITHKNMEPLLDALQREEEFQPGYKGRDKPDAWYRRQVTLEFPLGELAKGWLNTFPLVGFQRPEVLPLDGKEGFSAQGLEGKAAVHKDLFMALMNMRDILPPYRGRIITHPRI
jgi:hypothetical protein